MPNAVALREYDKLLDDISVLFEEARDSWGRFCWKTGKRIVEVEQKGAVRAEYGSGLIEKLSEDLTRKYGKGFSVTNLRNMRQCYLDNRIHQPAGELPWTSRLELLRVKDPQKRATLEKRAEKEGLTKYDLRPLIKAANGSNGKPAKPLPPLIRPTDLKLNTFKLAKPEVANLRKVPQGKVLVDCGFFSYRPVLESALKGLLTETPSYTYSALVERVVDGDTIVVLIDTGFENTLEEKLRLRGINTPELGTPEGERAKKYVQKLLPVGATIVLKSHKTTLDLHGRFVEDVFYLNPDSSPEEIISEGAYLNQELLDKGYAVRMEE